MDYSKQRQPIFFTPPPELKMNRKTITTDVTASVEGAKRWKENSSEEIKSYNMRYRRSTQVLNFWALAALDPRRVKFAMKG